MKENKLKRKKNASGSKAFVMAHIWNSTGGRGKRET